MRETVLGIDIGTSSVKVCLLDLATGVALGSAQSPEIGEIPLAVPHPGWAEQDPEDWWSHTVAATRLLAAKPGVDLSTCRAIGIAYQMHGLVLVREGRPVRPSLIWCDSRAVESGQAMAKQYGVNDCLERVLNLPGGFTGAKLRWIRNNEPDSLAGDVKMMLPGDYVAFRLTDQIATTPSGLSEMILWDFQAETLCSGLLYLACDNPGVVPDLVPTFGDQGAVSAEAAAALGIPAGIPVTYRAGDQPNNALSLGALDPGEVAATAGTSGVAYAVVDQKEADADGRVNTFLHVNHEASDPRLGILLCLNGVGSLYSWVRRTVLPAGSFGDLNALADQAALGSGGLRLYPWGNGAERVLQNQDPGASIRGLRFGMHGAPELARAALEGIAFGFRLGLDHMAGLGLQPKTFRVGRANLFQSDLFAQIFSDVTGCEVEFYETDGAQGAARGAAYGLGAHSDLRSAMVGLKSLGTVEPNRGEYESVYQDWRLGLSIP